MYAERKGWDIGKVSVSVDHEKIHARDCETCSEEAVAAGGKIDRFHRSIKVQPGLDAEVMEKLLEIADKCPVHRTLHSVSTVTTTIDVNG